MTDGVEINSILYANHTTILMENFGNLQTLVSLVNEAKIEEDS